MTDVSGAIVEFCTGVTADGNFSGKVVSPYGGVSQWEGTWSAGDALRFDGRHHGVRRGMETSNENQVDEPYDDPFTLEMNDLHAVRLDRELRIIGTLAHASLDHSGRVDLSCYKPDPNPTEDDYSMTWVTEGWQPALSNDGHVAILDAGGGSEATAVAAGIVREWGGFGGGKVYALDAGKAKNPREGVELLLRNDGYLMDGLKQRLEAQFSNVTLKTWPEAPDQFAIAVGPGMKGRAP